MSLSRSRERWVTNTVQVDNSAYGLTGLYDYQYTDSMWEQCVDSTHPRPYRTGGGLYIQRSGIKYYPTKVSLKYGASHTEGTMIPGLYIGWAPTPNNVGVDLTNFHAAEVNDAQSRVWKKARPGKAGASVGQFLGELHKIPTIPFRMKSGHGPKSKTESFKFGVRRFKDLGGEYLNIQFGWIPFLKDLRDFVRETHKLDEHLRQLARDNGRPIRRRAQLPVKTQTYAPIVNVAYNRYLYPFIHPFYYGGYGKQTVERELTKRRWISARFRYWVPDMGTDKQRLRSALKLYGAFPTPSLVWELTPWSWLADWHSNIGDVLDNLSGNAAENLVADYAYFMQHSQFSYKVTETANWHDGTSSSSHYEILTEIKERTIANPYGFDLGLPSYSAKQIAILGALGISRLP